MANEEILNEEDFQLEEEISEAVYGNEIVTSKNLCTLLEVNSYCCFIFFN